MHPDRPDTRVLWPRSGAAWLLALSLGAAACTAPEAPGEAVARYRGGMVSATDLEELVLALPEGRRPQALADPAEAYRPLLEQVTIRRLLLERGRKEGVLEQADVAAAWTENRKQIVVAAFVQTEFDVGPVPEEAVREWFEENRQGLDRPERREVYHLFLRPGAGETHGEVVTRMSELRKRALAGEPFPMLAREYSDSQRRSADGALGWVQPGQLAAKLDRVIFALEEGVPSEVLTTESGAHLFLAARIVEAEPASFDQARNAGYRLVRQQRQAEAVEGYLEERALAPEDLIPTAEELQALLAGGDPNAIVLRVGDVSMTARELLERAGHDPATAGSARSNVHPWLEAIVRTERLAVLADEAGVADRPEVAPTLERARESLMVQAMQRRVLEELVEANPAWLEDFHAREGGRFAPPLRLRFERLVVPLSRQSGRVMAQLAQERSRLVEGETSLADVAAAVGGSVEESRWQSLERLLGEAGSTRSMLAAVEEGGFSEAITNGREIEMFHVLERSEPQVPELAAVRSEVRDAYLQANGESLYKTFVDSALSEVGFRIVEGALEEFVRRASGLAELGDATKEPDSD